MSTGRKVIIKGIADAVTTAGGFVTFPILAQHTGADGYGAYGQVNTITSFIIPFASLGLAGAMVRYFAEPKWTQSVRRQIVNIIFGVGLIASIFGTILWIGAPVINRLFLGWIEGDDLFRWGALLVVIGALEQLLLGFFRARQWVLQLSIAQIVQTGLLVSMTFILLPSGFGIIELVQATLLIKIIINMFLMVGFWLWNRPQYDNQLEMLAVPLRKMIPYGLSLTVAGYGLWLMHMGDRLVIGYFLTSEALGVYGAVYKWVLVLSMVNVAFNFTLYPQLMQAIGANNRDETARVVQTYHRYILLISLPGAIFLMVIMKSLLLFLGGNDFQVDIFLIVLIIGAVFLDQINGIAHYVLQCVDQVTFVQNTWLVLGLMNILFNLLLVPIWGLSGAAFVTFVTFVALESVFFVQAQKFVPLMTLYRFDVAWKSLIMASLAAMGMGIWFISVTFSLLNFMFGTFIFGFIYFVCMILLGEINRNEIQVVARAIFLTR